MSVRQKTVHGVSIGILMLRTRFRRYPGDIGHAGTWPFPVAYRVVEEATPAGIPGFGSPDMLAAFVRAGQELVAAGVDGIATSCGFLAMHQDALAAALGVPVASSALLQVPVVQRLIGPARRVGVLTYSAEALDRRHLEGAGAPADTPVAGLPPDGAFVRAIRDGGEVALGVLRAEVLEAADRLLARHGDIGAIVCECTNLAPFSADIAARHGLPVYDAVSLVTWFQAGLRPRRHPAEDAAP